MRSDSVGSQKEKTGKGYSICIEMVNNCTNAHRIASGFFVRAGTSIDIPRIYIIKSNVMNAAPGAARRSCAADD